MRLRFLNEKWCFLFTCYFSINYPIILNFVMLEESESYVSIIFPFIVTFIYGMVQCLENANLGFLPHEFFFSFSFLTPGHISRMSDCSVESQER